VTPICSGKRQRRRAVVNLLSDGPFSPGPRREPAPQPLGSEGSSLAPRGGIEPPVGLGFWAVTPRVARSWIAETGRRHPRALVARDKAGNGGGNRRLWRSGQDLKLSARGRARPKLGDLRAILPKRSGPWVDPAPVRSTGGAADARAPSWRSTAPRSPRRCSRASSSATRTAPSPPTATSGGRRRSNSVQPRETPNSGCGRILTTHRSRGRISVRRLGGRFGIRGPLHSRAISNRRNCLDVDQICSTVGEWARTYE
jgi:hypothetical protein